MADASRYGVIEIDQHQKVLSLEEKTDKPKIRSGRSRAIFFRSNVVDIAKAVTPSPRGELEITEVIKAYIDDESLCVEILPRGLTWLDTGTHESMMQASQYVYAVEERSGVKIACLEEIALNKGWVEKSDVQTRRKPNGKR